MTFFRAVRVTAKEVWINGVLQPSTIIRNSRGGYAVVTHFVQELRHHYLAPYIEGTSSELVDKYSRASRLVGSWEVGDVAEAVEFSCNNSRGVYTPWGRAEVRLHHLAVLGGTGAGKSTFVRVLLDELGVDYVVFDPHGFFSDLRYVKPAVGICDAPPRVVSAVFGLSQLSTSAPKLEIYANLAVRTACRLRNLFRRPVDAIRAVIEAMFFHEVLKQKCKTAALNEEEDVLCRVYNQLSKDRNFAIYSRLFESRDADTIASLYRYFTEHIQLSGIEEYLEWEVDVERNVAVDLSQWARLGGLTPYPVLLYWFSKLFSQQIQRSGRPLLVVIDEFAALVDRAQSGDLLAQKLLDLVHSAVVQGRKFGFYVAVVTQTEITQTVANNADLAIGRIRNSRLLSEISKYLTNASVHLLKILPSLTVGTFLYVSEQPHIVRVCL